MEQHLFNLRMSSKEMERAAKKCEKEEVAEKNKLKKAIQKGNMEGAKIHAENAIRQKNQALNFYKYATDLARIKYSTFFEQLQETYTRSSNYDCITPV